MKSLSSRSTRRATLSYVSGRLITPAVYLCRGNFFFFFFSSTHRPSNTSKFLFHHFLREFRREIERISLILNFEEFEGIIFIIFTRFWIFFLFLNLIPKFNFLIPSIVSDMAWKCYVKIWMTFDIKDLFEKFPLNNNRS